MRTYKLTISYDGTRYQGWQRQATTDNTIQHILEWSIGKLVGYRVRVDGSGRTDAGVHARGQVASVQLSKLYDVKELKDSINRYLPEDIRIMKVELMKNGFHARKSAKGKKYEYYIDCREKPDVFSRRYCYHYPHKLDIEAMREAADYMIGPKNFTSFTDDSENKDPVRRVTNIKIVSNGEKLRITYYGTGFMYHMVRIMTSLYDSGRHCSRRQKPGRISGTGKGSVFKKSVLLMPLLSILKMEEKNRRQEHRRLK